MIFEKRMRKAIINRDTCKPTDCASSENKPCIKYCPGNRTGLETIVLGPKGFPHINPLFCTGCGICVKKCPFHCYKIINLPEKLDSEITHKYAPDTFTLFRMLLPSKGRVLGVIGQNGIGKSTALKILSGSLQMNFGKFDGGLISEEQKKLHTYYSKLLNLLNNNEAIYKGEFYGIMWLNNDLSQINYFNTVSHEYI